MEDRTKFSIIRTRLAAERTLMSWIRTSFAMITFGFGFVKFFQYLQDRNHNLSSGPIHLGFFLVIVGIFNLIPAMIGYRKLLNLLHLLDESESRWSYAFVVAILVGLIGLYALFNAMANFI